MGKGCFQSPFVREIWRLRLNWLFFILSSTLYGISLSTVTSFHQFITNPSSVEISNVTTHTGYEPGFGLSEMMYAFAFTVLNIGELIGALSTGMLAQFVSYGYISFAGLMIHILSYVLYALSTQGWMLIVSRLFSGIVIGSSFALAPSYFSETHELYLIQLKQLGEEPEQKKKVQIKDMLYAFHALSMAGGFLLGMGATVVFAQFPISQFRAVAWFNVAVGVLLILLQFALLRGESRCQKLPHFSFRCCSVRCTWSSITWVDLFIIGFLVIANISHGMLTVIYTVLINPILGDSFGFSERETPYFFLGLVTAQIAGAVIIIVLQNLRLNSRISFIIAIITSIAATALMADWQSLPYDPCMDYSLYHNPALVNTYKQQVQSNSVLLQQDASFANHASQGYYGRFLWEIHLDGPSYSTINATPSGTPSHLLSTSQIKMGVVELAAKKCNSQNASLGCHWIPKSIISGKVCSDCRLLCRGVHKILNFVQFWLGAMLLLMSVSTVRVSLVNVIIDYVNKQIQSMVIGIAFTSAALSKIVSPLWIVAAYEKTNQHTIIPMCIMIGIQLVMLVTFLLLYVKLAVNTDQQQSTKTTDQVEEKEEKEEKEEEVAESEPEHEETELTHLVPEKADS